MNRVLSKYKRELVVVIATLAMAAVFTIMNPLFITWRNLLTVLQQMVLNGILAVGMMFSIITGGIDLSIGCTFAITGISVAWCCVSGVNPWLAILIGILIGVLLGAFNGFLVNKLKLQPFIATLGTMNIIRGGHFSSGRIETEDHGPDGIVPFRLFQLPAECLCRLMLGKGQFRIVPDGVAQRRKLGRFGIDHLIHCFFIHDTGSFHRFSPAPYLGQELY